MGEEVVCLACGLNQPNPTPRPHAQWWMFGVTVCVRCGGVWAKYAPRIGDE